MSRSSTKGRILIIEDDTREAESLQLVIEDAGYAAETASSAEEGIARAEKTQFDVVVTDFQMSGLSGLDLIKALHPKMPQVPIILITAHEKTETAIIDATRHGAYDYVFKPITNWPEFLALIGKAIASRSLRPGVSPAGEKRAPEQTIVGRSGPMQKVFKEIGRVAARPVTVLIRGETGTGKELIARALHQHSDRAEQPFVIVNCVAIPETLLESELFGHEQGAFTGAQTQRLGKFEQAGAGTIFLDEIGDLSPAIQAKFLRVLQERNLQRLGGKETIAVS